MREPFKLRSGNKTSFKMMGSSPVKKLVGKQKNIDVNNNNRIDAQDFEMLRQKDSPAELDEKASPAKILTRLFKKGTKRKIRKDMKNNPEKYNIEMESLIDEITVTAKNTEKVTKGGKIKKSSKEYKSIKSKLDNLSNNAPEKTKTLLQRIKSTGRNLLAGLGLISAGRGAYDVIKNIKDDFDTKGGTELEETETKDSTYTVTPDYIKNKNITKEVEDLLKNKKRVTFD